MTPTITQTHEQPADSVRRRLIVALSDVTRADVTLVGQKAANLGELREAGYPVPDGIILTTHAWQTMLAGYQDAEMTAETIKDATLPEPLITELIDAVRPFGEQPLAVRSSGVAEDLPGMSFAGQYETVLNVRGADDLQRAVKTCWSSAFSGRVGAYRGHPLQRTVGMAVLIQPMVPAEAAGVAFSADPVTGARDQVVINAVRGLGERLVSGSVSPDQWVVSANEAVPQATPEHAIDVDQARAVAHVARDVERRFGCPQDIEWAIAGGQVNLLQARPITALPPRHVQPPPGFWTRETSHNPKPFTPFCGPLEVSTVNAGFRAMFDEFGFLIETLEIREIGGWMYLRMVPIDDSDLMGRRVDRCVQAMRSQHHRELITQWEQKWRPDLKARLARLFAVDLTALSDPELDEYLGEATHFFKQAHRIHFLLQGAIVLSLGDVAFACRELLGWDDAATLDLLNGLSSASTGPALRLRELAEIVRTRPRLAAWLENLDTHAATRLNEIDAEFATAFRRFQDDFGSRGLSLEFADPTLREEPALLLRLIRDQVLSGYDPEANAEMLAARREAALESARSSLTSVPLAAQERFERALAIAQRAYPLREDNEPYTISGPTAVVRYAALELGKRLAARGQFDQGDDVFWLDYADARAALRDGQDRRSAIITTRAKRAWIDAHPGPASYGMPPGPPPPMDQVPAEVELAMRALQWHAGHVFGFDRRDRGTASPAQIISGIAASPGSYSGPARLVLNETEFHKIRPGDVLVCPATTPVWSVVFPQLGALVTDSGGLLSHPAIIAREYGIPAIVATGNATSLLRDGERVTVDGTAGVVRPATAETVSSATSSTKATPGDSVLSSTGDPES
jgi:rifampicin phosphotransferase